MESYDRNRLINNINYLLKQRGIKNKDLEAYAGVSPGYISRISADSNTSNPGIDYVCKVANFFEIPFNVLISENLADESHDEELCRKFIHVLYDETKYGHIIWLPYSKKELESADSQNTIYSGIIGYDKIDPHFDEDCNSWQYYYKSIINSGEYVKMKSNFYSAEFDNRVFVIAYVTYEYANKCVVKNEDAYELWLIDDPKKPTPLFSTFKKSNNIKAMFDKIIAMCSSSESNINLSDSSIASIKKFLLEVDE